MSLSGMHILLAEDNPTNQMVAAQMLASLGAEATLAEDGVAALELALERPFDLALIDIEMPRMDGTEVIRRIRSGPAPQRDMPLIALTAYVMREHRAAIDEAGADGVIAKPILSIEGLGRDILDIVARRRRGGPAPAREAPADRPPAPSPSEAGIDARIFEQLSRSIGPAAIAELLRKMDRDVLDVRQRIAAALPGRETQPLREATHILVAVAGSMGAVKLQNDAQCLNSAAHTGDYAEMERLGRVVISEIDLLRAFIRSKV